MEHRWGERVPLNIPIRLSLARPFAVGSGRLRDLSVSGAWISTDHRVRMLSQIDIVLNPGRVMKSDSSVVAAYVTRQCKNGIGIEWCQFAPPTVAELLRSVTVRPFVSARGVRSQFEARFLERGVQSTHGNPRLVKIDGYVPARR